MALALFAHAAAKDSGDYEMEDVEGMEELMKDPRMYPMSWEYRAFTRWPTRQQAPRGPQVQGGPGHQVEALMAEGSAEAAASSAACAVVSLTCRCGQIARQYSVLKIRSTVRSDAAAALVAAAAAAIW